MSFQTITNMTQAPGVEGDPCSTNERQALLNPTEGAFVAGSNGLTMGRFAWIYSDGKTLNNSGSGAPNGFVKRSFVGAITAYLAESGMSYIPGAAVGDVFSYGDFWVKNAGSGASTIGMKAFASTTTGQVQFAAAGATVSGYVESKWFAASVGAAGELVKMTSTPPA